MAKPFKIHVSDEALTRLKKRLELTTFPTQLEGPNQWSYGAPVKDVKRLAGHWQNGFDWRKVEAELNKIPQYITPIEMEDFGSIDMHYIYQKSEVKRAIPLLFVHGCT
jgi:Epoxide hydrolase N terminus